MTEPLADWETTTIPKSRSSSGLVVRGSTTTALAVPSAVVASVGAACAERIARQDITARHAAAHNRTWADRSRDSFTTT